MNLQKRISVLVFAILLLGANKLIAQTQVTAGDNPTSTELTNYPQLQSSPLRLWNSSGTGWFSSTFAMGSPNGRLNIAVANEVGAYGGMSKGDIVFQMEGLQSNKILFNLNTTVHRTVQFGTHHNQFKSLVVSSIGKVGIGTSNFPTTADGYLLFVNGGIKAEEVKVELASVNGWADYVFAPTYKLMPLIKLKNFITINKHLPNIPSAETLVKNGGLEMGKMLKLQQEKIEENTLYIIDLNEKIETLIKENEELKKRLSIIESAIIK
jgi:hypothetical protein